MIKTTAKLTAAATAIAADSGIASWVTANFPGMTLKIFVGDDAEAPAGSEDAPFVTLAPSVFDYELGDGTDERHPSFDVDFGIVKKEKTTSGQVTTCDGLALSDALGHLLLNLLKTTFGNGIVDSALYTLTPVHPLYEGGFTVTLKYEGGMGEP